MKILNFNNFLINEETISIPQVIEDFVSFLEEQPIITMYPEDVEETREGWVTKESKMYSIPGIKKYFKNKYGDEYTSLSIENAIQFDPNIKILTKKLADKGMTLQSTPIKGQYGETSWFYSVNLSDEERTSIKGKYESEFKTRYAKYSNRKELGRKASLASSKPRRRSSKVSESMELLIECLFSLRSNRINEKK